MNHDCHLLINYCTLQNCHCKNVLGKWKFKIGMVINTVCSSVQLVIALIQKHKRKLLKSMQPWLHSTNHYSADAEVGQFADQLCSSRPTSAVALTDELDAEQTFSLFSILISCRLQLQHWLLQSLASSVSVHRSPPCSFFSSCPSVSYNAYYIEKTAYSLSNVV